ncbi:hypothetical protein [Thermomonospora echinospora]|uniref:hypothetical protein n=1 Tax=Thermomonospora echinospora TaxID=1992 RepID=UPI000CDE7666|nr:hypothetical protein [Thermomonospora echinospora]
MSGEQETGGEVLVGSVVGKTGEDTVAAGGGHGVLAVPDAPPSWVGKPIGELTAGEAIEALAFLGAHRLGDEVLAQVLASVLVRRPPAA